MSHENVLHGGQTWQERLAQIMETMRELSNQIDPQAMVREYYARMRLVNPHIDRRLSMSRRGLEYPEFRITRFSEWSEPIDPWKQPERLPLISGGILAELIYGNEPRIINDLMVSPDDPALEYLQGQRSLQAIPLMDQGKSLNMSLHLRRVPDGFHYEQLPEAVWLANLFGRATNNLVLAGQLKTAYEEIDRELKAVARIQRSLLPLHFPEIPRLRLSADYQTARRAGGDYYDFFPLKDGLWGMLIADVSGHGTPAAVMMAVMHSIAHTYAEPHSCPCQMLNYLNSRLCRHYVGNSGTFVTAFYGIFNPSTRQLTYSSSGHNPPRLRRGTSGTVESLEHAQSFPLGVSAKLEAIEATVTLDPGDILILYTDGIVEAMAPNHDLFGQERLDSVITGCASDPQAIIQAVNEALQDYTAGAVLSDDRTLVVALLE